MRLCFRPLPELEGVRKQSLNYVDTELAAQYQTQGRTRTIDVKVDADETVSETKEESE